MKYSRAWRGNSPARWVVLAFVAGINATPGRAAPPDFDETDIGLPVWEAGVGVAALRLPDYRGADRASSYLLPFPYLVYRGERLKVDREGFRARLLDWERVEFDLSSDGNFSLNARDNPDRAGMATLYPLIEIGPELVFKAFSSPAFSTDLRLAGRTAFAVGGGGVRARGWVLNPYLLISTPDLAGSGWEASVTLGALYGSRRYHDYLVGVPEADARPERPAFAARAGFGGSFLTFGTSRRIGPTWVGAYLRIDSLQGSAIASSPLVRRDHTWSAGVALSWSLWRSAEVVR